MAVRVYDLAHKFQIPSKEIIAEAAKRGIKVKVASSTIDKITAEWFESELIAAGYQAVAAAETPKAAKPAAALPPTAGPMPTQELSQPPAAVEHSIASPAESTVIEADEPMTAAAPSESRVRFIPSAPTVTTAAAFKVSAPVARAFPTAPKAPTFRPGPRHAARHNTHGTTISSAAETVPATAKPSAATQTFEKVIRLKPPIIVKDLATELSVKPFLLIQELMAMNVFASLNQTIDEEIARQVCARHNIGLEVERRERHAVLAPPPKKSVADAEDRAEDLQIRPPVVTIMGHVDHGKTSLLDAIRKTNVVAGEAGGITQHIGAYTINVSSGGRDRKITFLDTPGHEAFTKMRARGANITDIAVLVVGADDGVQPQTLESINHARAASVPIIVALNKIDKPNADIMGVKKQLQQQGLAPEDWGGQTILCEVSALNGAGIEHLLEMILLQAELMDLKANPKRKAKGTVIEASLEQGRGPVATLLVRNGTLSVGDAIVIGPFWGKARAMADQSGQRLKEAPPSTAVEVIGLSGVPEAGIEFAVLPSEREARELAAERELAARQQHEADAVPRVTLENLFEQIAEGQRKELKIVLKADVQGSVEAITEALAKLPTDKIRFTIIHTAVGNITENDVMLASASHALIIGFHIRPESGINDLAEHEGVEIRLYTIIYELIDACRKAQEGLLEPILKEVVVGHAEVRQIFELSKGVVAGCMVTDGRIVKNARARLLRNAKKEYQGQIGTLRRFQDEIGEVRAGLECGLRLADYSDYKVGDVIESYQIEKVAQKL